MTQPSPPSPESWLWRIIAAVIVLTLFAGLLPKILPSLIALSIIAIVLRLVWFFTSRY